MSLGLVLGACSDGVTAPGLEPERTSVVRWNALAREIVIASATAPPTASRAYAYLSVAQYVSALAARGVRPDGISTSLVLNPPLGAMESAIVTASADVLAHLFPAHVTRIEFERAADLAALRGRSATASALELGETIARDVAQALLERASTDRADAVWRGAVPNGPGLWTGSAPQFPMWGQVKPWLWGSGSDLRVAPPPAFGSEAYRAALEEVRRISDTRTATQLEIARFWADGAGTYTPPGHWNEIAADLIGSAGMDDMPAARTMALVNVAMMDAIIGCWDSKYTYWVIRPYQADPAILTPIGQPPHPSYPSGHACSSGAAAGVLSALFPTREAELTELAVEACDSRVYAGIHYRFDAEAGMEIGRRAAARTLEQVHALVTPTLEHVFRDREEAGQPDHGVIATRNAS